MMYDLHADEPADEPARLRVMALSSRFADPSSGDLTPDCFLAVVRDLLCIAVDMQYDFPEEVVRRVSELLVRQTRDLVCGSRYLYRSPAGTWFMTGDESGEHFREPEGFGFLSTIHPTDTPLTSLNRGLAYRVWHDGRWVEDRDICVVEISGTGGAPSSLGPPLSQRIRVSGYNGASHVVGGSDAVQRFMGEYVPGVAWGRLVNGCPYYVQHAEGVSDAQPVSFAALHQLSRDWAGALNCEAVKAVLSPEVVAKIPSPDAETLAADLDALSQLRSFGAVAKVDPSSSNSAAMALDKPGADSSTPMAGNPSGGLAGWVPPCGWTALTRHASEMLPESDDTLKAVREVTNCGDVNFFFDAQTTDETGSEAYLPASWSTYTLPHVRVRSSADGKLPADDAAAPSAAPESLVSLDMFPLITEADAHLEGPQSASAQILHACTWAPSHANILRSCLGDEDYAILLSQHPSLHAKSDGAMASNPVAADGTESSDGEALLPMEAVESPTGDTPPAPTMTITNGLPQFDYAGDPRVDRLPAIAAAARRYPIRTLGDGNCLLHGLSLAMWGTHERDQNLRAFLARMMKSQTFRDFLFERCVSGAIKCSYCRRFLHRRDLPFLASVRPCRLPLRVHQV